MSSVALADSIESDLASGYQPAAIIASVGSTGVTAIDPVAEIAVINNRHKIWLHFDDAMALSARLLPECRHLWHGVEDADSIS
jgi:aromatic-L-amino-acid decarboxylase